MYLSQFSSIQSPGGGGKQGLPAKSTQPPLLLCHPGSGSREQAGPLLPWAAWGEAGESTPALDPCTSAASDRKPAGRRIQLSLSALAQLEEASKPVKATSRKTVFRKQELSRLTEEAWDPSTPEWGCPMEGSCVPTARCGPCLPEGLVQLCIAALSPSLLVHYPSAHLPSRR